MVTPRPATFFPVSAGNGDSVALRQPRIDPDDGHSKLLQLSKLLESQTVVEASYNYGLGESHILRWGPAPFLSQIS